MIADVIDKRLLDAIADGLPLVSRPYAAVAARLDLAEDQVIRRLKRLAAGGVIKRFGVVVRHRELGYTANAMVVWDVPEDEVAEVGARVAAYPFVTLCYRRTRRPPEWPYNFYCMIHGKDRAAVLGQIATLNWDAGLARYPQAVLFSRRRFKQRGARYAAPPSSALEVA
jgi:DNA-binding Lrp family transcriptional regulator